MAIYYVKPSGSDAANGLTPATAWATIGKIFASGSVVTGGDTVYIAPGAYRELITAAQTAWTSTVNIIGDPTASLVSWGGIQPGKVRFTSLTSGDTSNASSSVMFTASSRGYMAWQNIAFEGLLSITSSGNTSFTKCSFQWVTNTAVSNTPIVQMTLGTTSNYTFSKCIFDVRALNNNGGIWLNIDNGTNHNVSIVDCVFALGGVRIYGGTSTVANNINIYNCTFYGGSSGFYGIGTGNGSRICTLTNCYFLGVSVAVQSTGTANILVQYSRAILCPTFVINVSQSNNAVVGAVGVDVGENLLFGLTAQPYLSSLTGYANVAFGTATGAPTDDMYGITWVNTTPDAGAMTYQSLQLAGSYYPTERNASTITIAPGSTSQSIELYLGVTGLTASTSGLSAYYNRTRSADVQINLQARNITQNWTSGGFAEVNPNTMPGVYRLDIPNEALAAGADDVTVVVRGASGTNGAVMSIKLSSGGLTTAQTATAVWGALTSDHTTHGTYGWNVLRADQTSKQGLVGLHQVNNNNRVDADVHAIVNDQTAATYLKGALNHDGTGYVDSDVVRISTSTAAANELEGALLHNGTDYIDSNLLSGNSTRVFVGRFQLTQTGITQGDIIEAFTTDTPSFELQLFDGDNNIVPVTGATLGLRILDVTSTVVETGTPTIEYGTGGIVRWTAPGSYVSIGCPAGMYRLFVDRTVSGTTTTFGPLQIKVQVQ